MHPYNMSTGRRWLVVIIVSMGSLCVACTSSIYSTTYAQILEEFHCPQEIAALGLSLFIWGLGLGPLILSPLSEGVVYLGSFTFFLIWLIPCAVAKNIQTLLVARFLDGDTVGDIFPRLQLATPMMVYTASPFVGPKLGSLAGGFINQYTNWRWIFYALIFWAATMLISIYFFVPETYPPVLLKRKAQAVRKVAGNSSPLAPSEQTSLPLNKMIIRSIYRPIMLLTLEPMCFNLCIYSAILLGILYLSSAPWAYFLSLLVGMIFAILSDPYWRSNYSRLERNHQATVTEGEKFCPEWRLPPVIAGAPLVTAGLFIFTWTVYPNIHWIVSMIGSALFGAGTILVYSGIFTFLVDVYSSYAASALAANSFVRSKFGGIFPLFGTQMYNRLGLNWASCLLAYIFYTYGTQIRKKSRFAS
ncbi:efflux pump antibiotic resistance protein [Aspergillus leporis]|uniref:Efflux pump antibiotic resistance protein n=1 Tax=Aspergillus leporis TaxID=41062 RepID=A0A5N5XD47_9EURO|nr:efflux pump antibiotic resistance protein [Aspergillus leporis]